MRVIYELTNGRFAGQHYAILLKRDVQQPLTMGREASAISYYGTGRAAAERTIKFRV